MGAALVSFWCEKCKKRVCEALPKAVVWCACGRRAKPVGEVKAESEPKPKCKSGGAVQVGLPL